MAEWLTDKKYSHMARYALDPMAYPEAGEALRNALGEAEEEIHSYDWSTLRRARQAACRDGAEGSVDDIRLSDLAGRMVDIARKGLQRRGKGEEKFLEPLERRVEDRRCPADGAADLFNQNGIEGLLEGRTFTE